MTAHPAHERTTVRWTSAAVEAAREAVAPEGARDWFLDAVDGGLALHTVVRRWSQADEPSARLVRLACGTALYAARLAVAVHGRRPVVTSSTTPGVVAVLRAGASTAASPVQRAAYAALRRGGPADVQAPPSAVAVLRYLRRAADSEGARLSEILLHPGPELGPRWPGSAVSDSGFTHPDATPTLLLGAPGRSPWAEVQTGQALEAVVLAAGAAGLQACVLAAPADPGALAGRLVPEQWTGWGAAPVVLRVGPARPVGSGRTD